MSELTDSESVLSPGSRHRVLLPVFGAFILSLMSFWLTIGYTVAHAASENDFTLTTHNGDQLSLSSLRGRIVLIYFGFTTCPDICPLELSNIGRALNELPELPVSALFITVDPERDTIERLAEYVPFFHPDLLGLTGTSAEIRQVADQYKVRFQRIPEGDSYRVDHGSQIFVLDERGTVRALLPFGSTSEHLVSLIRGVAARVN